MNITESFKSLKHRVKHKYVNISYRIVKIIDGLRDIWYCGSLLARDQKVEVEGATAYSPTWYWALYEIFKDAEFTKDDSFVDIGCGEGRVLLAHQKWVSRTNHRY